MHELGIARNVVAIVAEHAGDRRVGRVRLAIGRLSAVMPGSIRFCFDVCAQGTVLEGAALEIDEIPGRAVCNRCGDETPLDGPVAVCACGSRDLRCIAGDELSVKEMELI